MKKHITLICMLISVSSLMAQKVVLTHEMHSFAVDKVNNMKIAEFVDPGNGGENQLWDLSKMSYRKKMNGTVAGSFGEDIENNFPQSNIVLNEFGNKFFFSLDEHSLKDYGMISKTGNYIVRYEKPMVKMKYPFHYGQFISGNFKGSIEYPNSRKELNGTYKVEADGYGKLLLPNGLEVENTLRVKTKRTYKTEEPNSYTREIVTYRWYAQDERFPLAVVQKIKTILGERESVSERAAYKDSYQLKSLKSPETSSSGISLFPNPVSNDMLNLNYSVSHDTEVLIELYNNEGKKIATILENRKPAGNYSIQVNLDEYSLPEGNYHIRSLIGRITDVKAFVKL